jgi:outer membrane lipoprotein SlyB
MTGKDPLQIYGERFHNNSNNVSYGLDYANRLLNAERPEDAIEVLKQVIRQDNTSKVAYRQIALAYDRAEMGQPQSFGKGIIISERNVTVKGTESGIGAVSGAVMGGLGGSQVSEDGAISAIGAIGGAIVGGMVGAKAEELIMRDNASEFIFQPDVGDPFTLIQINDEKLKTGDRVLIINSDKIRVTKDSTQIK